MPVLFIRKAGSILPVTQSRSALAMWQDETVAMGSKLQTRYHFSASQLQLCASFSKMSASLESGFCFDLVLYAKNGGVFGLLCFSPHTHISHMTIPYTDISPMQEIQMQRAHVAKWLDIVVHPGRSVGTQGQPLCCKPRRLPRTPINVGYYILILSPSHE